MKKFTLLLALALMVSLSQASKLKIRMWDNSSFTIELNGKYFPTLSNQFVAPQLSPGSHFVKIFKFGYGPYGWSSHKILICSGYINLPDDANVIVKVNRFNQFQVIKSEPMYYGNGNYYDNDDEYESYHNKPNQQCYNGCMSQYAFANLKNSMMNTSFDSSRLSIAKQGISMNTVCSQQVQELMNMLSFESSKLELAKFAYNHVNDKENYFMVNNAFTFSSSIDELNKFISY